MRSLFLLSLVPGLLAHPVGKRALSQSDVNVLQLAHFLENLELNLYTGGFEKFSDADFTSSGFPPGFREQVGLIAENEQTHRDTIAAVLTQSGQTPLPPCKYKFPYTDTVSFVKLANMITTVGIGAYIGGGAGLVDNTTLLRDASSILTNEVRHDSLLRGGIKLPLFPTPFDTSLPAVYAYTLASQFLVSCPKYLDITPLPKLTLESKPAPESAPKQLTFSWDPSKFFVSVADNAQLYIAFVNQIAPPIFEKVTSTGKGSGTVSVPKEVGGVAFAVLTTFSGGLTEDDLASFGSLAGPAEIVLA